MKAGFLFPIDKDDQILEINSPIKRIKELYKVILKNETDRWAIVALRWDGSQNALGIRWFYASAGHPYNRQSTWFILPKEISNQIINLLRIDANKELLKVFLEKNNACDGIVLSEKFETEKINPNKN